jgi:hypothetical protein
LLPAYAKARSAAAERILAIVPEMINAFDNKADWGTSSLASADVISATAERSEEFYEKVVRCLEQNPDTEQQHIDGHRRYNEVCARAAPVKSTKNMRPGMFREMTAPQKREFEYISKASLFWAYRYQLTVCHGHFLTIFSWPLWDIVKDPASLVVYLLSSFASMQEGWLRDPRTGQWTGSFESG